MSQLWPIRPPPRPDESLSSWLERFAAANLLTGPQAIQLSGTGRLDGDIDRATPAGLISTLAEASGLSTDDLKTLTFRRWEGSLFEQDRISNHLPWLPSIRSQPGRMVIPAAYCPLCLKTDETPYLRLSWRLAFVTLCADHGIRLNNRCPGCRKPSDMLSSDSLSRNLRFCGHCGNDLSSGPTEPAPDYVLKQQTFLCKVLNQGWITMGSYGPQYAFVFFEGLLLMCRLLLDRRLGPAIREWARKRLGVKALLPEHRMPWNRGYRLYALPAKERAAVLRLAMELLEEYPTRFIEACQACGLGSRIIFRHVKNGNRIPFALADPVRTHLGSGRATVTEAELLSACSVIRQQGEVPSYGRLTALLGKRFARKQHVAESIHQGAAYGLGRYWKLDGINPELRARARTAAKEEGVTIGRWMEDLLLWGLESRQRHHHMMFPEDGTPQNIGKPRVEGGIGCR